MAKYYNNKIKTGRVAGSVFAVRYGEVIERAYNPVVNNPKSQSQIESRAKMKLLSQMGAVMAPYIAIRREGAVSPRNIFIRINYDNATFSNKAADIALSGVKITTGVVSLPAFTATRGTGGVTVALQSAAPELSRVVYVAFAREADNSMRAMASVVATTPGADSTFSAVLSEDIPTTTGLFIYAYGVRDNTEAARVKFGDMTIDISAGNVAKLITSSSLLDTDVTVTETRFFNLVAQQ